LSDCPSHARRSTKMHLGLWLLQNTNRKPHAGSRTHWSAWLLEVGEIATKPSPATLHKHSLGGATCHMAYRFAASPPSGRIIVLIVSYKTRQIPHLLTQPRLLLDLENTFAATTYMKELPTHSFQFSESQKWSLWRYEGHAKWLLF